MIIAGILNIIKSALFLIFDWINIPNLPQNLLDMVDFVLDKIFDCVGFLGLFIRPTTLKLLIPTILILINFEHVYRFLMWILKKIPFLNMK